MNYKKPCYLILLTVAFSLPGCSCEEKLVLTDSRSNSIVDSPGQSQSIGKEVFELIDLNYPGLEKVKEHYEKQEYNLAAQALLNYFRQRKEVVNPFALTGEVTLTDAERKMADDALQYRFYIKNYTDSNGESYQFPKNSDGAIDWTYQPNKDGEFRSQLYRFKWFAAQSKAYKATGDEKYALSWIDVYGDFLKQYPAPLTEKDDVYGTYGPLPVAERIDIVTNLFFDFLHSPNFTVEWLCTYLRTLAQQVEYIKGHYYNAGNNIYVAQAFSVMKSGILFPEMKLSSSWLENGSSILSDEVSAQFLDDGMQFEVDLSYHVGVVSTFYDAMVLANVNNKKHLLPASFIESMRKATEVLMNLCYPDYSLEAFNDTRPVSWTKSVIVKNLKKYVEMFPENEEMNWMATSGKQGTKPTHLTKAFPVSGYYALRDGWNKSSMMLIHTNNPTAAWHNQGDNGTFSLYRNGRRFFPDSGCFTYNNGSTREWFRSAKQHNTMTLNDAPIKDSNRNGKFLKLETKDNTDILVTENQSYPSLKHRRAIFFVQKKFFVIVDEGIGSANGKVSLNFHLCEGTDAQVVYDLTSNGAHTAFADNNNMIFRTFGNKELNSAAFAGKISYNIDQSINRKSYEVNMNKMSNETARFITVLIPNNGTSVSKTVKAEFTDQSYHAGGASIKVTIDGVNYLLSYVLN